MSENTERADSFKPVAQLPIEQAAATLVEAVARLGLTAVPAFFAVTELVFENGAAATVAMGPTRATLAEALADAAIYGCGVALTARVIPEGKGDRPAPDCVEPEAPKNPQVEMMH